MPLNPLRKILIISFLYISCFIGSTTLIAQNKPNKVIDNDLQNLSFAVIDGESVELFADIKWLRTGTAPMRMQRMQYGAGDAAYLVHAAERGFGSPWGALSTAESVSEPYTHTVPGRMGNTLLQVISRAYATEGIIHHHLGQFEEAEAAQKRAYDLRSGRFGKDHFSSLNSMSNLAALYRDWGKFIRSEEMMKTLISTLEANNMQSTPAYAIALNNMAMLSLSLGRLDEAENYNTKAIEFAYNNMKGKDKELFPYKVNKALILREKGELALAEVLLTKLKEQKEKSFGKKKPAYARAINHLAGVRLELRKYDEVDEMLEDALKIYMKSFGNNHPATARIHVNLGIYYMLQKKYSSAEEELNAAERAQNYILGKNNPDYLYTLLLKGSNYELAGKVDLAYESLENLNDAVMEQVKEYFPALSEEEKTKLWSISHPYVLNYLGFVAEHKKADPEKLKRLLNTHWSSKGILLSSSKKLKSKVKSSNDPELLKLYEDWVAKKSLLAKYYSMPKKQVFSLGVRLDKLEKQANELEKTLTQKSGSSISSSVVSFDDVQSKLKDGEVLVEVIKTRRNDFKDAAESYIALIIKNGENPKLKTIGEAKFLEEKAAKAYRNTIRAKIKDTRSYTYFWEPVAQEVEASNKIYLSLDGVYNQISLATLNVPEQGYILRKKTLIQISSGKDLNKITEIKDLESAMLIGNPAFGSKGQLAPLPGTQVEVDKIDKILRQKSIKTEVLTGDQASEEAIKKAANPGLLHIATHGFFEEDQQMTKGLRTGFEAPRVVENPLLRSGLMLSGAELSASEQMERSGSSENGVLTAYEAMDLELNETQIVILSACETGLGDVSAGEGVYGLQRAFQIAGAKTIITSLWKVNDQATQELMTRFIQELLNDKPKQEAFRIAQLALVEKYEAPYFWGAFVMLN